MRLLVLLTLGAVGTAAGARAAQPDTAPPPRPAAGGNGTDVPAVASLLPPYSSPYQWGAEFGAAPPYAFGRCCGGYSAFNHFAPVVNGPFGSYTSSYAINGYPGGGCYGPGSNCGWNGHLGGAIALPVAPVPAADALPLIPPAPSAPPAPLRRAIPTTLPDK